ncbi:hypothetical protein CPT_Muldoon_078 [Serratia phage Muldoon]|uniref:Uncharacterized protein n=1 Tax=Serratia phage Muldoon TaxID=2601678 RepID=A0A5P8PHA7_9CAUD|nr:hypothetical protein HYP94_gp077 [Serratia phage Muldoon]QFR56034.1 hypothetical protein CPT_Muldoon_078 [Serratia phage Muldoon]
MTSKVNVRKFGILKMKEMSDNAWLNIAGIDVKSDAGVKLKKLEGQLISDVVVFDEYEDDQRFLETWADARAFGAYCIPFSFFEVVAGEVE